jgi:hypothetical protein
MSAMAVILAVGFTNNVNQLQKNRRGSPAGFMLVAIYLRALRATFLACVLPTLWAGALAVGICRL